MYTLSIVGYFWFPKVETCRIRVISVVQITVSVERELFQAIWKKLLDNSDSGTQEIVFRNINF